MPTMAQRVEQIEREIASVKPKIDEMHETFVSVRGLFTVLEWAGRMVKPLLYIGAFLAAGYAFLKTGVWPK
jgi:uncharacterized protein involved in exopolysaccharide biosynthesis